MPGKNFYLFVLIQLAMNAACSSSNQNNGEETNENNNNGDLQVVSTSFTTPVPKQGQKRFSPDQLLKYFPEKIGTYERSKEVMTDPAKKSITGNLFSQVIQSYYPPSSSNSITIKVEDYGDDPSKIASGQNEFRGSKYKTARNEMNSFVNERNLREFHEASYRIDEDDTIRNFTTFQISNPRFSISVSSSMVGDNDARALTYLQLKEIIYASQLDQLFALTYEAAGDAPVATAAKKTVDCDNLLPQSLIAEVCGESNIKLTVTDFENESNCNRVYKNANGNNIGGLYFLVTQYTDPEMAIKAVEAKLNDNDMDYEPVAGLGQKAAIVKIDDAYYLSFAQNNRLIEIRSVYNGLDQKATCCLCYGKDLVIELAGKVAIN